MVLGYHIVFSVLESQCSESYRVIRRSLCTWRLYCNHQGHRDFWSPCICSVTNMNLLSVDSPFIWQISINWILCWS